MNATASAFHYQDGDVIKQKWHFGFVVLAYVTAFIGSYSAIRILEHGLWRSEREKANATLLSLYPRFATAFVLGSCGIWSMHFVGMQAIELEGVDMCYNWLATVASLCLAVSGVWAGVSVAKWDVFAGEDRLEVLKELIRNDSQMSQYQLTSRHVHMVALFDMLHWIAAGSFFAALGALSMHYVGMIAMTGPFYRVWSFPFLAGSVAIGVTVCFAGFWILFRPLHWKAEKSWYRQASAAVIALAVCMLHFLGMLSVTYIADSSQSGRCDSMRSELQGWRPDQFQVLCVAMAVPFVAFCIEHTISTELRTTYRQLLDVRLSGSDFISQDKDSPPTQDKMKPVNSKTRDSGLSNFCATELPDINSRIEANEGAESIDSTVNDSSQEIAAPPVSYMDVSLPHQVKPSLELDVEEGNSKPIASDN